MTGIVGEAGVAVATDVPSTAGAAAAAVVPVVQAARAPRAVPNLNAVQYADFNIILSWPDAAPSATVTPTISCAEGHARGVVVPLSDGFQILSGLWLYGGTPNNDLVPVGPTVTTSLLFPCIAVPGVTHVSAATNETASTIPAFTSTLSFFELRST